MWHEDPTSVWYGLAMKVIEHSCWCAISLAPFLKTTWLSAVRSASAYLKLISCCPGPASPFEFSTTSPAPFIALRIPRIRPSSYVVARMW